MGTHTVAIQVQNQVKLLLPTIAMNEGAFDEEECRAKGKRCCCSRSGAVHKTTILVSKVAYADNPPGHPIKPDRSCDIDRLSVKLAWTARPDTSLAI